MKGIGKALRKAGDQADKASIKAELDKARDEARDALAAAEQAATQIQLLINSKGNAIYTLGQTLTQSQSRLSSEAYQTAERHIQQLNAYLEELRSIQSSIMTREATVRANRGKVSSVPDEGHDRNRAVELGKQASQAAVADNQAIQGLLPNAYGIAHNIDSLITACNTFIQSSAPVAGTTTSSEVSLTERLRQLELENSQLRTAAATQGTTSSAAQTLTPMMLQQQVASTAASTVTVETSVERERAALNQ